MVLTSPGEQDQSYQGSREPGRPGGGRAIAAANSFNSDHEQSALATVIIPVAAPTTS